MGDALYSWRTADGNKPGLQWLKYSSRKGAAELHAHLTAFLKNAGFELQRRDSDNYEWWSDRRTNFGFALGANSDGLTTHVDVVVNTGFD